MACGKNPGPKFAPLIDVAHNAAGPELFVVEELVELDLRLEPSQFGDIGVFEQDQIPIVDPWTPVAGCAVHHRRANRRADERTD